MRAVVVDEGKAPFVLRSVSVLVDATAGARALGVRPGMRVLDAQRHAPSLVVDVVEGARLAAELAVVAEVLLACSPVVEPVLPAAWTGLPMACVALDLQGMVRPVARILTDVRRACARLGHAAVVVASPGTRLSLALARAVSVEGQPRRQSLVVEAGGVERVLAALPVRALDLSAGMAAQLQALGAATAADLVRLLPKGGVERLGADAGAILDTVGARRTPLRGIAPPERLVEALDLEHPLTALPPLSFLLNNLCNRLCIRARAQRQRVAEVRLTLRASPVGGRRRDPRGVDVAFPDPLANPRALLRALTTRLERVSLEDPVDHVALEALRLARRGPRQLALPHVHGAEGAEEKAADALVSLLAEMSAELGADRVGCLVVTDDPLPERMTRLAWPPPPPPPRPAAPERRRPRKVPPLAEGAVTRGGRFLAAWPWPLRLLPRPARPSFSGVARRELLGVLEGEDKADQPYARTYELVVLADGRRALLLVDDELDEEWVCGWFD